MEHKLHIWSKEDIRNASYYNKSRIEETTAKLIKFYSDDAKVSRKAQHLCKCCFYFNTSRIGGSAITTRSCAECDIEMHFGNTCTDVFCNECAAKLSLCKHCGAKMD